MTRPILSISRAGVASPLGLHSAAVLAAVRAGLTRFERLDEPAVTISRLTTLDANLRRSARMQALMRYALAEVGQTPWNPRFSALPIFLALPDKDKDSGTLDDESACLDALRTDVPAILGLQPLFPTQAIVRRGRAGLFAALSRASAFLATTSLPYALVGAVDSLVAPETIAALAIQNLLLGERNLDGRIVSEAAGFFLVGNVPMPDARGHIVAIAEEQDEDHCFARVQATAALNTAPGLTRLFRQIGAAFSSRTDAVFSAQPGEGFWGREFSYAYLRNVAWMPEPLRMKAVGTAHGDTGAAAGAMALLHALASFRPPRWSTQRAAQQVFSYGASDRGELGACALISG